MSSAFDTDIKRGLLPLLRSLDLFASELSRNEGAFRLARSIPMPRTADRRSRSGARLPFHAVGGGMVNWPVGRGGQRARLPFRQGWWCLPPRSSDYRWCRAGSTTR